MRKVPTLRSGLEFIEKTVTKFFAELSFKKATEFPKARSLWSLSADSETPVLNMAQER